MKLVERLDKLYTLAKEVKETPRRKDPDRSRKLEILRAETRQCENILQWFRKEMTKPSVQMSLDPYLARGQMRIPLANLSGVDFESFAFECIAADYNGTVLEKVRASCRAWKKGDLMEFLVPVTSAAKKATILIDSVDYEVWKPRAAQPKKPEGPVVDTVCPYCKKEIIAFSLYCQHCGKQLLTKEARDRKKAEVQQYEIEQEKKRYLKALDDVSKILNEEALCEKVDRLRQISENVYIRIQEKPDMMPQVRKFDNIYLPAIENAVRTYVGVRDAGVDKGSVEKSRADAEMAIDIGIHSSQNLLNSLFKGDQLNVEGDIEVLKQMFTEHEMQTETAAQSGVGPQTDTGTDGIQHAPGE